MDVEIVTVGTELLLGFTVDTNAADIARTLSEIGVRVIRRSTVGDDERAIGTAVGDALDRTGFVLTTGGLGPTRDDITKHAIARVFDVAVRLDPEQLTQLERRWARLGRPGVMPAANRSQAEVPEGAGVLPNPRGTAPGLWMEGARGTVVLLPGVPHEMRGLLADEVVPRLRARMTAGSDGQRITASRVLRTTGIPESRLADRIGEFESALRPATLAYLPSFEGVDLRLTVWESDPEAGSEALDRAVATLTPALGDAYYGDGATPLAAVVVERLRRAGRRLAVAESCTGGLVAKLVTDVPGASKVFAGGVVAYADEVKARELGVPSAVLAHDGAVSEATVAAMARGVAERFGADVAVAVSGIAGPEGGTPAKPVGTVWLSALATGEVHTRMIRFPGARDEVRRRSAQAALDLVRRALLEDA